MYVYYTYTYIFGLTVDSQNPSQHDFSQVLNTLCKSWFLWLALLSASKELFTVQKKVKKDGQARPSAGTFLSWKTLREDTLSGTFHIQGLSEIITTWNVSCERSPHTEQATQHNPWVSESPFSGDKLGSKDSFHFPVPNTTTLPAFPNLPPALQGHLILSNDYTGNRRTEITVNLNSANSWKPLHFFLISGLLKLFYRSCS